METIKVVKLVVAGIITVITAKLGNLAIPLYLLLALMTMDFMTALSAAKNRKEKIESERFWEGIRKKVHMLLLILLGLLIDILLNYLVGTLGVSLILNSPITIAIALWLVINEIISVLENMLDIIGDEIPKWLKPLLEKVRSKIEEKTTPEFCKENPEAEDCKIIPPESEESDE